MRRSKRSESGTPSIPGEALREVERALEDLALAPRAEIRKRTPYIYIEIDGQRSYRLEYLFDNGRWALDILRRNGAGYGERGDARFFRQIGQARELLEQGEIELRQRADHERFLSTVVWLLTPRWWLTPLYLLLFPLLLLGRWLVVQMLVQHPQDSETSHE